MMSNNERAIRTSKNLYDRTCLSALEKLGEYLPKSSKNLIELTTRLYELYTNSALPRLY